MDQMPAELHIPLDAAKLDDVFNCFYPEEEEDYPRGECPESEWPEWRIIAQLEKFRKMQLAASARGRPKVSGDLLMLEASEFLKHFDESGDAKDPDKLVPLNPRRTPLVALEDEARAADFEEALRLSHPALHYLRQGEDPEATDYAKVIRQIMGARETNSSCVLLAGDKKADFVSKTSNEDIKCQDKHRAGKRTPLSPLADGQQQRQQQQHFDKVEKKAKGAKRLVN